MAEFAKRVLGLVRSRRARLAVAATSALSIANLLLSIAIARESSVQEFGDFSLAMLTFIFSCGVIRAALTETSLASPSDGSVAQRTFVRVSLVSLAASPVLFLIGVIADNYYFMLLAATFHGLCLLDSIRTHATAIGNGRRAAKLALSWALLMGSGSLASLWFPFEPIYVFVLWAVSGAALGYTAAYLDHVSFVPKWPRNYQETKVAFLFSLDYIVGSGGSVLSTALLGFLLNPVIVGGIRGAGTVLGPIGMVSSTARSLSVAFLGRSRMAGPKAERRAAYQTGVALAVVTSLMASIIVFIPDRVGLQLLGDTWNAAAPVLVPIAIETILALVSSIPAAGIRVAAAGRTSLVLRLITGIPRPFIILWLAVEHGLPGAAWGMAAIALINTVLWWAVYDRSLRMNINR